MGAQDIGYVELYASNRQAAIDYFVLSLGFTVAAESTDDELSSVLLRLGGVRLVVTSGPGTEEFLDTHGDGIADIAFTCDDVAATYAAAVAAGAAVRGPAAGNPVVRGFGGVRHTLLPHRCGEQLPVGRTWTAIPVPAAAWRGRCRALDHVAICLEAGQLQEYVGFYADVFGLAWYSSEYVQAGGTAMDSVVVRSPSGAVTFTMLEPDSARDPGQLDSFLARNSGAGVQHLAFEVDEIIPAVRELRARGVEFLSTPPAYYDRLAERLSGLCPEIADLRATHVLADRDEWGYLLQLFTRSPYERNTLFYELIQRRGARGFGSANIRALYDAVEQDRLAAQ